MNNKFKMIGCTVLGFVLGSATIVGANQAIQAMQNTQIKVKLNGQVQEFKDETTGESQYPITYNNRTYLPLRNVANLSGLNVDYDKDSNTALLNQDIIKEIITKAEEQLGETGPDDEQQGRKVVRAYVRGIDIADDVYIKTLYNSKLNKRGDYAGYTVENPLELGHVSYEGAYNYMIDNPIAKIPISGSITYMIEYEDDFKGYWAGNGPAYYTGVYAIGERIFTYKDGVLSFGTGGSKEFEDYESIAKDTTTSKDSKIKSINEVDLSYNDVGKKYILTDTGEVYLATFTNKSDLKESDIQYKKLEDIKDKVVDIKLLHTGQAIVICTLSDGTELYIHELNGEYKGAYKYYPFINGYNYVDNRHTYTNDSGRVETTQGISFYEDKVSVWYEDLTDRDISHGTGMEKPHVIFNIEGTYDVSGDIVTFKFDKCICKEPEAKEYSINGEVQLRYDGHSFEVVKWTKDPEEELLDYNEVLRKDYVYNCVTT